VSSSANIDNMIVGKVERAYYICISVINNDVHQERFVCAGIQFDTLISAISAPGCAYFFVYMCVPARENGVTARYEKLARRRCRLRATIRSGTGIPGPIGH